MACPKCGLNAIGATIELKTLDTKKKKINKQTKQNKFHYRINFRKKISFMWECSMYTCTVILF